jgi:hypothetical protein
MANVLFYDNTIQITIYQVDQKGATSFKPKWNGLLTNNQTKNFTYHKKQLKNCFQNSNKRFQLK